MSDFVDSEASVASSESEMSDAGSAEETSPKTKKKSPKGKKKKRAVVDSSDSEEEEEDDEEKIAEEMKDLINDDDIEEEEGGSGSDSDAKRKHEDSEIDQEIDDEDYDLIEENLGIKVKRTHKRKRIRMMSDDEDSDQDEEGDGKTGREAIAEQLFEGDDEEAQADTVEHVPEDTEKFADLEESEEESDVDDFIVDDEGRPISKGKKKKHIIHSDHALQEAQDIFGVDFDFQEFEQYDEEYSEEEEEEEEYEDEEAEGEGEARPKSKKKIRKRPAKKSIFEVFEPSDLERGHLTDVDNEIRVTDMPERFQLRSIPVMPTEQGELDEEAEWIYKHAFVQPSISTQDHDDQGESQSTYYRRKGPSTVGKIKEALNFMRNEQLEVPFIAFYRKEYVNPELNINDLWKVWQWDEKWTQLRNRKQNMVRLFEKMQQYQFELIDPDKPLPSYFRSLSDEDIDRARNVQSIEIQRCLLPFLIVLWV